MGKLFTHKRRRRTITVVASLAFAVVLASCGSQAAGSGGAARGSAAGGSVTLRATEFKFEPAQLKVARPGELTITVQNRGAIEHDFVIDGVEGRAHAKPGETAKGVFKLTRAGPYTFICSIPGHKDAGMTGTLTVG